MRIPTCQLLLLIPATAEWIPVRCTNPSVPSVLHATLKTAEVSRLLQPHLLKPVPAWTIWSMKSLKAQETWRFIWIASFPKSASSLPLTYISPAQDARSCFSRMMSLTASPVCAGCSPAEIQQKLRNRLSTCLKKHRPMPNSARSSKTTLQCMKRMATCPREERRSDGEQSR